MVEAEHQPDKDQKEKGVVCLNEKGADEASGRSWEQM